MRFIKNGPSIPDELLIARDEGRVVFFCGAGVSRAHAKLPDFFELAEKVIQKLGVLDDNPVVKILKEAKEIHNRTGVDGLISADRMFGLLERKFFPRDIEPKVAQALKPTPRPYYLTAHRILIDLATTPEGKVRIVTTNFDRLFDRCDKKLTVWKPPKLPDVSLQNELDGIVYLHGCVNEDYSDSEGDGFVLSSSGFGRAYLSEGWATAFIKEILDRYSVVFIGYSADDPPIHYLLEALNQHGQPSGLYAFQDGTEDGATAQWEHKGVKAIAYSADHGHRALWKTLAAWAERARNPDQWIQSVISMAMKGPECLQPYERGQVAHIISTDTGAKQFSNATSPPPAEWLCVFDAIQRYANPGSVGAIGSNDFIDPFELYGLDSDLVPNKVNPEDIYAQRDKRVVPSNTWNAFSVNKHDQQNLGHCRLAEIRGHWANNIPMLSNRQLQVGVWISKVADQPAAIWWAAKQTSLHPAIQQQIKHHFENNHDTISSDIHQTWHYLFESWDRKINHFGDEISDLEYKTNQYGWNCAVARKYIVITRPYLTVEQSYDYRGVPPKGNDCQHSNNLLRLDVEYPRAHEFDIPDEWLAFIVPELRKNLETASQLETEIGGVGLSAGFSCPIIPENSPEIDGYERSYGVCGSVILFSRLFERLIHFDVANASQECSTWPVDDEHIFTRLRIWAGGLKDFLTAQIFSDIVLGLSENAFCDSNHRRDLLLALASRWNEMPRHSRDKIEQRMLSGREEWLNAEDNRKKWNTFDCLNRITWLANNGCNFSFDLEEETNRLRQIVPDWKPENAEKAVSSNESRGGLVSTDPEFTSLLDIPIDLVLSKALEVSKDNEEYLIEKDPFSGLSEHHPVRAFKALTCVAKQNKFPQWAWSTFLSSDSRKNDRPKLLALIAERLCRYPNNAIIEFIHPVSQWLLQISQQLASHYPPVFDKILLKFIKVIEAHPSTNSTGLVRGNEQADWVMEAINAPAGKIAQAIFKDPRIQPQENADELRTEWLAMAENLLKLSDDLYRYVLVIFCSNLNWFYAVAPDWIEKNLLSVLDGNNTDNIDAFWSGLFCAQVPDQPLYTRLKPHLLNLTKQQSMGNKKYAHIHAQFILAGWVSKDVVTQERLITTTEMREQVLDGGDKFGASILHKIKTWSDNTENVTHIDWPEQLLEFFRDAWPLQISAKTSTLSASLCEIAVSKSNCFSERIKIILPLLTTISNDDIYNCDFQRLNNEIAEQYPAKTLDLLHIILPNEAKGWPSNTGEILQKIYDADAGFKSDERLLELRRKWNAR